MIVAAWGGSAYKRHRQRQSELDSQRSCRNLPSLSLVRSILCLFHAVIIAVVAVILLYRRAPHFDMTFSSFIWSWVVCSQLENFYASCGRWWSV